MGLLNFGIQEVQGTYVSGTINIDTTWDLAGSPYIVVDDVMVESSANLIIEPGVEVYFNGNYNIYVNGTFTAIGTDLNKIIFTSNMPVPSPGDWGRIRINPTGHAEVLFCEISYGDYGIVLDTSSNNKISNNHIYSIKWEGIHLKYSSNNNITENNISNSYYAIRLISSSNNNEITYNNLSNNGLGVNIKGSNNNKVLSNSKSGIGIIESKNITLKNNTMEEYGLIVWGYLIEHWNTHSIDTSNTFNGRPIQYWKNQTGGTVPPNAGGVILANCENVVVQNQNLCNGMIGIELGFSNNNIVINNNAYSNSLYGIYLYRSYANNITDNNVYSNHWYGILLQSSSRNNITDNNCSHNNKGIGIVESSSGNIITENIVFSNQLYGIYFHLANENLVYHNNIINNSEQAYERTDFGNQWDNGYPSGGNYWSDYDGIDLNSTATQNVPPPDGIGDIPYTNINSSVVAQDNYPLMYPFGNFFFLYEGWNLISIPFIQTDLDLGTVLSSIKGSYKAVQWYNTTDHNDHWKHNCTTKPDYLNDLDEINHTMGFWIYITKPGGVLFRYFGIQPTENQTITLYPGWNLVGYPSSVNKNLTASLNNLNFTTDVQAIWSFDAATKTWEELGLSDIFEPGRGYWIYSNDKKTWEVPL